MAITLLWKEKEYFLTYNVSAFHSHVCTTYDSVVASSVSTAARALTTLYRCSLVRRAASARRVSTRKFLSKPKFNRLEHKFL